MKRKRKGGAHRRRRHAAAAAPKHRRSRRRLASNPFGIKLGGGGTKTITYAPRSLIKTAIGGAVDAVVGTVGMSGSRMLRGKLGLDGNTIKGSVVELAFGIAAAPGVAMLAGDNIARAFIQGVFMGPTMSMVKSKLGPTNPIAIALGDEGELPLFGTTELGGIYDMAGSRVLPAGTRVNAAGLGSEMEVGMM